MIVSYYSIFLQKSILWLRCMYYSDESSRVKQGRGGERAGCTKYALKQTCVKALSNSLKQKTACTTFPFATARNSITRKSVSQFTFTRYCTNFLPLILVFCISLLCPFRYNNKQDTIGKGAPLQCKQPNFKPIILRPHRHGYRAAVFILAVHRWHAPDGIWIEVTANNKTVWQSGKVQSSAILLMIGGLLCCFEEKLSNVLFYFSSGFATWYISDRLFLVIASICRLNSSLVPYFTERTPSHILLYITCFLAVYAQTERRIFRMAFLLMARISVRSAIELHPIC